MHNMMGPKGIVVGVWTSGESSATNAPVIGWSTDKVGNIVPVVRWDWKINVLNDGEYTDVWYDMEDWKDLMYSDTVPGDGLSIVHEDEVKGGDPDSD